MRPSSSAALDVPAQARQQVVLEVLDVGEHLLDAVAAHDVRQARAPGVVEVDVHDVRVAEQVVQVAQDLLVGADQEEARGSRARPFCSGCSSSVRLTSRRSMKRSILPSESQVMSARIARRVGFSFEAVDRQHREELVDRPGVGHRLEDREVQEVGVRQVALEVREVVRHVVQRRA